MSWLIIPLLCAWTQVFSLENKWIAFIDYFDKFHSPNSSSSLSHSAEENENAAKFPLQWQQICVEHCHRHCFVVQKVIRVINERNAILLAHFISQRIHFLVTIVFASTHARISLIVIRVMLMVAPKQVLKCICSWCEQQQK